MDAVARTLRFGTHFSEFTAHVHLVDLYNVPLNEGECRVKWSFKNHMHLGHSQSEKAVERAVRGTEGYLWQSGDGAGSDQPDDGLGSGPGGMARRMYRETRHAMKDMKHDMVKGVGGVGKRIRSGTTSAPFSPSSSTGPNDASTASPTSSHSTLPEYSARAGTTPTPLRPLHSLTGSQPTPGSSLTGSVRTLTDRDSPSHSTDPSARGTSPRPAPVYSPPPSFSPSSSYRRTESPTSASLRPSLNTSRSGMSAHSRGDSYEGNPYSATEGNSPGGTGLTRWSTLHARDSPSTPDQPQMPPNLPIRLTDPKGSTSRLELKNHACHFDQHILCAVAIPISKETGALSACPVRLSIRHKVRVTPLPHARGAIAQRVTTPSASTRDLASTLKAKGDTPSSSMVSLLHSSSASIASGSSHTEMKLERNKKELHEEMHLGELCLDLSEFVASGRSNNNKDTWINRRYLLQNGRTNALLRIAIRMEWIGGERVFRAPQLKTGTLDVKGKKSTQKSPHAQSSGKSLTFHNNASSTSVLTNKRNSRGPHSSASSGIDIDVTRSSFAPSPHTGLGDVGSLNKDRLDASLSLSGVNRTDYDAKDLIDAIFEDKVSELDGSLLAESKDAHGRRLVTARGAKKRMDSARHHDPNKPPHAGYHHHHHRKGEEDDHSVLIQIPAGAEPVTGKHHSLPFPSAEIGGGGATPFRSTTPTKLSITKAKRYEGLERARIASEAQAQNGSELTSASGNPSHASTGGLVPRVNSGVFKPFFLRRSSNASIKSNASSQVASISAPSMLPTASDATITAEKSNHQETLAVPDEVRPRQMRHSAPVPIMTGHGLKAANSILTHPEKHSALRQEVATSPSAASPVSTPPLERVLLPDHDHSDAGSRMSSQLSSRSTSPSTSRSVHFDGNSKKEEHPADGLRQRHRQQQVSNVVSNSEASSRDPSPSAIASARAHATARLEGGHPVQTDGVLSTRDSEDEQERIDKLRHRGLLPSFTMNVRSPSDG